MEASTEMFKLAQDQRMGFRSPSLIYDLLNQEEKRALLSRVLTQASKLDCSQYAAALSEMNQIVPETNSLISFALSNGEFDPLYERDLTYIFETLQSLSNNDGYFLHQQSNLLELWLNNCGSTLDSISTGGQR